MRLGFIVLSLCAVLAVAQLVQPPVSKTRENHDKMDLLQSPTVDFKVRSILKRACADCHSNEAHLPWYGRVSPMSWLIANHPNHMSRGRENLNFSEWPRNSANQRQEIADSVDKNEMPLTSYVWLHRDALLSDEDRNLIDSWADSQ